MTEDLLDEVAAHVRDQAATGFFSFPTLVQSTLDFWSDGEPDDVVAAIRTVAEREAGQALARQLKRQQGWPAVTDCDRFDAAFAELESAGIVCRHNFTCCCTCAACEIIQEIQDERERGREIIGCVHYNEQDTEAAVRGQGLYLSYDSVLYSGEASLDIGRRAIAAMEKQGVATTWNGELERRIHVQLDWKRRWPT